ncbi:MAG: porin [Verrucomicrobia bacterium]|nr:porin [Verrucomicrobiota bacterium]
MKFNKWTLGLAAIGVVSLASAAQAEEKMSAVQTALSSTTISGYVDTSAQWNFGTGNNVLPLYKYGGAGKADGFNLNVVQISIAKPLDESDWAAGYKVDLWYGPDANTLGTSSAYSSSDFAIKQAYVALRAPLGNGLDFKMGVFDSIIGYESSESGNNPNYTRSFGHTIEPSTHTGLLATYRFADFLSVAGGVANTMSPTINGRADTGSAGHFSYAVSSLVNSVIGGIHPMIPSALVDVVPGFFTGLNDKAESSKTYMGSIALTAPDSWGWATGSTLYGGIVGGYNSSFQGTGLGLDQVNYYVGVTLATPVTGLKVGVSFDYLSVDTDFNVPEHNLPGLPVIGDARFALNSNVEVDMYAVALYASYQATEKLSLHARGEYFRVGGKISGSALLDAGPVFFDDTFSTGSLHTDFWAVTGTVQYDLWKNVVSRLEFRWDYADLPIYGGITSDGGKQNQFMLAANVIYKF